MRQTYDKSQREYAKKKKLPLICIGWNGEYQSDPLKQSEAIFWGPVSDKTFNKIRKLLCEACKDRQ